METAQSSLHEGHTAISGWPSIEVRGARGLEGALFDGGSLMADTSAAQFDEQLRESVLQARQSAKASASELVGAGLQLGSTLVGDTDGGRTTIDPLPWIHCGACFAPSQRVT
jgi:hypothetical protein